MLNKGGENGENDLVDNNNGKNDNAIGIPKIVNDIIDDNSIEVPDLNNLNIEELYSLGFESYDKGDHQTAIVYWQEWNKRIIHQQNNVVDSIPSDVQIIGVLMKNETSEKRKKQLSLLQGELQKIKINPKLNEYYNIITPGLKNIITQSRTALSGEAMSTQPEDKNVNRLLRVVEFMPTLANRYLSLNISKISEELHQIGIDIGNELESFGSKQSLERLIEAIDNIRGTLDIDLIELGILKTKEYDNEINKDTDKPMLTLREYGEIELIGIIDYLSGGGARDKVLEANAGVVKQQCGEYVKKLKK